MRLDNLHIDNFGKLSDFSMEFSGGYNRIYGENEFGKTTVMAFIKMMFYGSSDCTVRDMYKNPRKKYAPVSHKTMGGQIEFTLNNVKYRLERTFGQSLSGDKISAVKLSDGTSVRLAAKQEPGVFFFGMGVSAFEKSIFIGQLGNNVSGSDKDDEIATKLSSLASGGDENVSAAKALAILSKERESYLSKGGSKGICDRMAREITLAKDSLAAAKRTELELSARADERITLEEKIKACEERCAELNRINRMASAADEVEALKSKLVMLEKLEAVRKEEKDIEDTLTGGDFTADASFADRIEHLIAERERLFQKKKEIESQLDAVKDGSDINPDEIKNNLDGKSAEAARLRDSQAESEKKKAEAESKVSDAQKALAHAEGLLTVKQAEAEHRGNGKGAGAVICGIVCAVAAITFAVLGIMLSTMMFIPCGIAVVCGIAGTVLLSRKHTKASATADDSLDEYEAAVSDVKDTLESVQRELDECCGNVRKLSEEVKKVTAEENELRITYEALVFSAKTRQDMSDKIRLSVKNTDDEIIGSEKEILSSFEVYKHTDSLAQVRTELDALRTLLERLNTLRAQEAGQTVLIGENTDAEKLRGELADKQHALESAGLAGCDYEKTRKEYDSLVTDELPSLKASLVHFDAETKQRYGVCRGVSEIEEEIRLKQSELDRLNGYIALLDIASDTINEADSELRMNFGPELNDMAKDIMQKLTGVEYEAFTVSKSLDVSVRNAQSGMTVPWQLLSSGTVDQTYLALRIAVSRLLCNGGESYPLLLDDVLLQYDNSRREKAEQFLEALGESTQIIHFTCRK